MRLMEPYGTAYVVCGWFTPDYSHWADRLCSGLDGLGEVHDFVCVPKVHGGWELNTMRKAAQVGAAMHRHPDKSIVFLDVDCEVRKPLAGLADIRGDIAVHMRCKFGKGGVPRLGARSGTMVFRPTARSRAFVEAWADISARAPKGCVDQRTLPMAIAMTPGLSVDILDVSYCAVSSDNVSDPVVLHDSASRDVSKHSKWVRQVYARFGIRPKTAGPDTGRRW